MKSGRFALQTRVASALLVNVLSASVVVACAGEPTGTTQGTPVVSLTLVVGETLQVATIAEAQRADSAISREYRGIGPERAQLFVVGPDSVPQPLLGTVTVGRYKVRLDPEAGKRYRLWGSIDGRTVTAETVAPSRFVVRRPSSDTITAADGDVGPALFTVPYDFESSGATGYEARVMTLDGSIELSAALDASQGELLLFRREPGLRQLVLLAYNNDASEWLLRTTPRSNLTGAFGGFGAALVERRALVLP